MRVFPALFFVHSIYLYCLADALVLPLLDTTTTFSSPSINDTFTHDEGHHFTIPRTPLTLHITLLSTKIPLPAEVTLLCLHNFVTALSLEPQANLLDRIRVQTAYNVEAILAPVKCPGCGLTYKESIKILAGLWYYTSREKLLFAQRYGVFDSRTGRMVAWGKLLMAPPMPGISGGIDMVSTLSSGLAEMS